MVMLCSDGLVNMVPDRDIEKLFQKYGTAAEITQRLVTLANENGGKDNITVVIAHINPSPARMVAQRLRNTFRRHGFNIAWLLMLFLAAIGGFFAGAYTQKQFSLL
jgi:serine/threonine protein phosphatase PrpC